VLFVFQPLRGGILVAKKNLFPSFFHRSIMARYLSEIAWGTVGWVAAVIPRHSKDIHNELPEIKGFSERNIGRVIAFYREYPASQTILPQAVAKLPEQVLLAGILWDHNRILCERKDKVFAEYALRDIHKPIGVSEYELTRSLPENLKGSLPSIEEIENEMSRGEGVGDE